MSLEVIYANDEDLRSRLGADFLYLVPREQRLAAGTDGVFSSADRWTLTSASNDFVNQGAAGGMVCRLPTKISPGTVPPFGASGEAFAVDATSSLTPHDVLLRRIGAAVGAGYPPGPAAG